MIKTPDALQIKFEKYFKKENSRQKCIPLYHLVYS